MRSVRPKLLWLTSPLCCGTRTVGIMLFAVTVSCGSARRGEQDWCSCGVVAVLLLSKTIFTRRLQSTTLPSPNAEKDNYASYGVPAT